MSGRADRQVEFELALASDVGRLRERNEDSVAGNARGAWALVADGMGGHRGGDVASAIVSRVLGERLERLMGESVSLAEVSAGMRLAIEAANQAVYEFASQDEMLRGMGSTVVAVCALHMTLVIGHVGDSRGYRLREGRLEQLTRDHSLLQELMDGGMMTAAEARKSPGRGVLTRSLGVDPEVEVEVHSFALEPRDLILLCSDGLTEMVCDDEIRDVLDGSHEALERLAAELVRRANQHGGRDNVSVALMATRQTGLQASAD